MRGDKEKIFGFESTRLLIRQAITEVVQVAQAKGIKLSDSIADDFLSVIETSLPPTYKPSTLVDLERGNRLEIEASNGALSCYGKELDIPTPVNDFIYACLKPFAGGSHCGMPCYPSVQKPCIMFYLHCGNASCTVQGVQFVLVKLVSVNFRDSGIPTH